MSKAMKKSIALFLAIILGISLFAGCGGSGNGGGGNGTDSSTQSTSAPTGAAPTASVPAAEIKGTTVEMNRFTVLCPDGWEDQTDNPSFSKFKKDGSNVGCDVTVQFSGSGLEGWESYNYDKVSFDIGGYTWEGYDSYGIVCLQAKLDGSDEWCVVQANGCSPTNAEVKAIIASITVK